MKKIPTALLIMDGCGIAPASERNAVSRAATPNLDRLNAVCPHTELQASGLAVGLPEGQIGNSEVGHTNIGAGRVVFQMLPRISHAIADGSFFENRAYVAAMDAMHGPMMEGVRAEDPDTAFVRGMIPHHQGAIDMAKSILLNTQDPEVRNLAQGIITEQANEIRLMQAWLARHASPAK